MQKKGLLLICPEAYPWPRASLSGCRFCHQHSSRLLDTRPWQWLPIVASISVLQHFYLFYSHCAPLLHWCLLIGNVWWVLFPPEFRGTQWEKLWYQGQVHDICLNGLRKYCLKRLTFHILNKLRKKNRLLNVKVRTLKQKLLFLKMNSLQITLRHKSFPQPLP